jgi:hypothetical protein
MQITEENVRNQFLKNLKKILSDIELLESVPEYRVDSHRVDLLLKIRVGNTIKNLVCEIKSSGQPRYMFQAVSQARLYSSFMNNSYPIVVTPHIGEKSREICKSFNVGYIDLDGNVFLKFDEVFIEKESKESRIRMRRQVKDLFAPLSSRIIRILLVNPKKSWTLSQLSKTANTSIGYAHKIARTLEAKGYAIRDRNYKLKLSRPRSLLDEWASRYDFISENTLHNFYTFERDANIFIKKIGGVADKNNLRYALTLHAGASLVAPYVRYTDVHFYAKPEEIARWKDTLNLRPVESGGTVMLVEPYDEGVFWGIQKIAGIKVVSNIQLYIDLFNYPARGREQAEFLRSKKIKFG